MVYLTELLRQGRESKYWRLSLVKQGEKGTIWTPAESAEDCGLDLLQKGGASHLRRSESGTVMNTKVCLWKVRLPGSPPWHGPAQWPGRSLSNPAPPLSQPTTTTPGWKFNSFRNWATKSLILDTSDPAREKVRLGPENRKTDWRLCIERWDSQLSLSSCRTQRGSRTSPPTCYPREDTGGLSSGKFTVALIQKVISEAWYWWFLPQKLSVDTQSP